MHTLSIRKFLWYCSSSLSCSAVEGMMSGPRLVIVGLVVVVIMAMAGSRLVVGLLLCGKVLFLKVLFQIVVKHIFLLIL